MNIAQQHCRYMVIPGNMSTELVTKNEQIKLRDIYSYLDSIRVVYAIEFWSVEYAPKPN